jgi:phosphoglycerate kinase
MLEGKINGTSVRVPVVNCSLVDLNVELSDKNVTLKDISELIKSDALYKKVYDVSDKKLVSGDFVTTTTPTILDINASIDMGNGRLKLMVWYDNEWSYSSQLIRLVEKMVEFNTQQDTNTIKEKYFVGNMDLTNKGVVCRFDFNVPTDHSGNVTDDFRISSSIETIKLILSKNPKYIVLTSHFGRPNGRESKYSLEFIVPILEKYLDTRIQFLKDGLTSETVETVEKTPEGIYLLENLRFHKEETDYEKGLISSDNVVFNIYKSLGDVFISDAFGCLHRKHLSICAMRDFGKPYGYGILIKKELDAINSLINNKDKKVLGIIGGAKIKDKLPIIQSLKKIPNSSVFIGGALAKQYTIEDSTREFVSVSGHGNKSLEDELIFIEDVYTSDLNVYDISLEGFVYLKKLLSNFDIIFWNGSLGVIEDSKYAAGSISLLNALEVLVDKTVIIGGGETASLVEDKNKNPHIYVSTGGGALLEHLQNKILYNSNLVGLEIFV